MRGRRAGWRLKSEESAVCLAFWISRPRLRTPRRVGDRGQRRVLRAEGEPDSRRRAAVARGRVHGARQVDGRVGNAAPPRAGRRLVHHPPRACRASRAAWTSRRPISKGTIPKSCAIEACDAPGRGVDRTMSRAPQWTEILPRTAAGRRHAQRVRGRARLSRDAPAVAHLPRRRRRTAARLRRGRAGLDASPPPRRRRSRRGRARRRGRRLQRHVLRIAAQPDPAGRRAEHGRRLGNEAAPWTRARLDDRQARRGGRHPARRGRYAALQRERARNVQPRRMRRRGRDRPRPWSPDADWRAVAGAGGASPRCASDLRRRGARDRRR